MESKQGENCLSLQGKGRATYPLAPCLIKSCYLYRRKSPDPLPLYLYIVKIENSHPVLTPSLRLNSIKCLGCGVKCLALTKRFCAAWYRILKKLSKLCAKFCYIFCLLYFNCLVTVSLLILLNRV